MKKTFTVSNEFIKGAAMDLACYAIGFVRYKGKPTVLDVQLAGSGTLVEIDGQYAILTANHVLESPHLAEEFGLIIARPGINELHNVTVKRRAYTSTLVIGKGKIPSEGPDLALLFLHDSNLVGTIRAKKSFYNLARHCGEVLPNPRPIHEGFWILSGWVHERTEEAPPEKGFRIVRRFYGYQLDVPVKNEYVREGFDYLEIKMKYSLSPDAPQSFQGYSGGGLWQVLIAEDENGEPVVNSKRLSGVAFYESSVEDDIRTIACHGRQSIYRNAIDKVRE